MAPQKHRGSLEAQEKHTKHTPYLQPLVVFQAQKVSLSIQLRPQLGPVVLGRHLIRLSGSVLEWL